MTASEAIRSALLASVHQLRRAESLAAEVAALEPWQAARQEVLPGVTGLWQVLGRSDVDWHERQQLDFSYAHSWSLGTDLRILVRTAGAVLGRKGTN